MNKIDREGANPNKVLRELSEQGLLPEEWGGHWRYQDLCDHQRRYQRPA